MPTPVRTPHEPVAVEYDAKGVRTSKTFVDPVAARRFYVAKSKSRCNPQVKGTQTMSKTAAPKTTKTTKAAPAVEKATKAEKEPTKKAPAKETVARDRFGCKEGSQAAAINAAITAKPQPAATIAEKAGLNAGRVRAHLKFLVEKGHVVETKEGFKTK